MNKEDFKTIHKIQKKATIEDLILLRNNFDYEIKLRLKQ